MRAVIYTTIYGNYDGLKEQPNIDADFVCFTDNPDLKSDQWQIRYEPILQHLHPRLRAKYFKTICPFGGTSLFIDGSIQIINPNILDELGRFLKNGFAVYKHPSNRDCISSEVELSLQMPKYQGLPLQEQADHYFSQGLPEHFGLWACGLILRDGSHTDFGSKWMLENMLWTYQDQVSLPYLAWREDFKIDTIELDQYACFNGGSVLFNIMGHNRND